MRASKPVSSANRNTIEAIGKSHLCTGCGTCAGICPKNAIEMKLIDGINCPAIRKHRCNGCGICFEVCPRNLLDLGKLNEFVFGKIPDDTSLGNYRSCYLGYSLDERLKRNASSGGIVTTLLIHALEEGIIEGALVTRMNQNNPLEPETIIAKTQEDVLSAAGSKYCPVSVNTGIKAVLESKGKFAVVGLPCHIQGIRKAELQNNALREKIVLHIGLFCSHTNSFLATQCILEKACIGSNNVVALNYRAGGWLGNMTIALKSGEAVSIPYRQYWDCIFGSFFFTPVACILCNDATNELSDISVGDPWGLGIPNHLKKLRAIVARTVLAENLLMSAWSKKQIRLFSTNCSTIKQSQMPNLNFKKKTIRKRAMLLQKFGERTPIVVPELISYKGKTYFSAVLSLLSIYLSSRPRFRYVLKYAPYPLLRLYFRLISAIEMSM